MIRYDTITITTATATATATFHTSAPQVSHSPKPWQALGARSLSLLSRVFELWGDKDMDLSKFLDTSDSTPRN